MLKFLGMMRAPRSQKPWNSPSEFRAAHYIVTREQAQAMFGMDGMETTLLPQLLHALQVLAHCRKRTILSTVVPKQASVYRP